MGCKLVSCPRVALGSVDLDLARKVIRISGPDEDLLLDLLDDAGIFAD